MALLRLPGELFLAIASHIDDFSTLNAFTRAATRLYHVLNGELYARDVRTGQGHALRWAAKKGLERTASISLAEGAGVDTINSARPFMIQLQYFPSRDSRAGLTPFQIAVTHRQERVARQLAEHGADIFRPYPKLSAKCTPLHVASALGLTATVRLLLENGAKLKARDCYGRTPLHYAVMPMDWHRRSQGNVEVVEYLIENGSPITIRDKDGRRPEDLFNKGLDLHGDDLNSSVLTGSNTDGGLKFLIPHQLDEGVESKFDPSVDKRIRRVCEAKHAAMAVDRLEKDRSRKKETQRLQEKALHERTQKDREMRVQQQRDLAVLEAEREKAARRVAEANELKAAKLLADQREAEKARLVEECKMDRQVAIGLNWAQLRHTAEARRRT